MKSRHDKLAFLNGLITGRRSISELQEETIEFFYKEGRDKFYSDHKGKEFTAEEFNDYHKKRPKTKFIVFILSEGCAPISDLENPREEDIIWKEQKTYE